MRRKSFRKKTINKATAENIKATVTETVEPEQQKQVQEEEQQKTWDLADMNSILTASAEKYFDTVYRNIKQNYLDGKISLGFFVDRCKELGYTEKLQADNFINESGNIREDVAAFHVTEDVKEMMDEEEEDKEIPIKFTIVDDNGNRIDPYAAEEEEKKKRKQAILSAEEAEKIPKPENLEAICKEIGDLVQKNLIPGAAVVRVAPYPEFNNDKLFQVGVMYPGVSVPWYFNIDYMYTVPGKICVVDYKNLIYVPFDEEQTVRTLLATNNIDQNEVSRLNKKYMLPSDITGILYHAVEGLGSVNYLKMTEENKKQYTYNLSKAMRIAMDVYDPGSLPRYRIADYKNVGNFKLISDDKVKLSLGGIEPLIIDGSRFVIGNGKIEYINKQGKVLFSGDL